MNSKKRVHFLLNRYPSHYFKNFSHIDFNTKGQEALIIEVGKVFIPLSKLKGGVDWLQEQSQPIMESEGHNRRRLCCSCGFCHYLQWKKPVCNGYSYISFTFCFCGQDHKHEKHFPKRKACFCSCKTPLFPSYCGEDWASRIFFPPAQM